MSDTSDTDLASEFAVVDPRNIPSFSSLFSPYSNKFGIDRKYLSMRFVETINLIEMDNFVDADFLINRVILITSKQITIDSYTRFIMFCVLSHLDLQLSL